MLRPESRTLAKSVADRACLYDLWLWDEVRIRYGFFRLTRLAYDCGGSLGGRGRDHLLTPTDALFAINIPLLLG